ncbi:nitrogenase iron-molybdenum cofactor biosynthesis protein NifN [Halorhodospira halophila]|uniref:Nitrogenase iron-molybdenum cofactor biosynthesis protein NifN n=1 Tax=Halorhodospira halophila (strain DSM 244 / SL1) TaxID=349124 RepID=A1WTP6_HALHL|nr:nitrogenase iron-molybdenum cofactor biosynthesis protein NifN [Halorhodospira halophila]ABM61058.1 nitrogenase molybdenum-iron cofactor biosynthesis protein NifN [Halorhodospira halophila SL1]MBK1729775.1 nitrogenase iron-molybdenum cofactor biosynthesis protein NifN [Halorhodospira halophila]
MTRIERSTSPLSVNPLKASQPVGGTLATLGFRGAVPLLHGAQGCTAFGKVYFVRHFNEPIPLQTTAIDPISAVLGADDNVLGALDTLCGKSAPALITLLTTGLSEAEGTDIERLVRTFREAHPEHAGTAVVPVNTPDFVGSLESGYAATVEAIIEHLVPEAASAGTRPGRAARQVNLLLSDAVSPGDAEALCELLEAFGLEPVAIPDLGASMDGHLEDGDFSPVTTDGTPLDALRECGNAAATVVVGASLHAAADRLRARTGVPDYRFDHLMGLHATDRLVMVLCAIAGREVPPPRVQRQRRQLQDALLDTHSVLGTTPVGVAAEADLLAGLTTLLHDAGAEVTTAVAPERSPVLDGLPAGRVAVGDLEALEHHGREDGVELILGSGHAAATAGRLGVPILQCGYPIWERVGLHARPRVGYRGSRDTLFELANTLLEHREVHGDVRPYRSIYRSADAA